MRIASRWAKTGSLKVLGDTQHPWQHVLRLGHIQATRRCRGMRDRAVWQAVWNSAVFRCISLYVAPYSRHASSRLPPGAIQPYSAIQRCMSIQLYSTIQHTPHTTPLRPTSSTTRRRSSGCGSSCTSAAAAAAAVQVGAARSSSPRWRGLSVEIKSDCLAVRTRLSGICRSSAPKRRTGP